MGDNFKKLIGSIYRKFNFESEFYEVIIIGVTDGDILFKWRKESPAIFRLNSQTLLNNGRATCPAQATVTYYTEAGKAAWPSDLNTDGGEVQASSDEPLIEAEQTQAVEPKPEKVTYPKYMNIPRGEASLYATVRAWRKADETPPAVN